MINKQKTRATLSLFPNVTRGRIIILSHYKPNINSKYTVITKPVLLL